MGHSYKREAIELIQDAKMDTHWITSCVSDCCGVPGYVFKPDLKRADLLAALVFWKLEKALGLLTLDGINHEITAFEKRLEE
jgi:hypothetical protein